MEYECGLVIGVPLWDKDERANEMCKMGARFAREGRALLVMSHSFSPKWTISGDTVEALKGDRHFRRRLRIAYPNSVNDIVALFSGIDTWRKQIPCALLLDGLHEFDHKDEEPHMMAFLCALFLETTRTCARILKKKCHFYISIDAHYHVYHEEFVKFLADNYFNGNVIHLQSE